VKNTLFSPQMLPPQCQLYISTLRLLLGQKNKVYLLQFQSPFFIFTSSTPGLFGPSALHFRHFIFLEKFTNSQLQQKWNVPVNGLNETKDVIRDAAGL